MEPHAENSKPGFVLEPLRDLAGERNAEAEQLVQAQAPAWVHETAIEIIRATRSWIQYGMVGFAVMCIVIGALEGLLNR